MKDKETLDDESVAMRCIRAGFLQYQGPNTKSALNK